MIASFSFFARFCGGPGEIRGIQMADRLGGRFNPEDGYEGDVCIYILGHCPTREPWRAFHDVIDCGIPRLKRVNCMTQGPVIAVSEEQLTVLPDYFGTRPLYLIPQHHCNFDNETRPDRPVRTVGCIGGDSAIQWPHHAVDRLMKEIGMEWRFSSDYSRRHKVVRFYRGLDIQVSFRPTHTRDLVRHMNPLKLSNAGSFGIPTVAFPEPAYTREWTNECLWAENMGEVVAQVRRLRDEPALYEEMSARVREKAKGYHIERIAGLYRALVE